MTMTSAAVRLSTLALGAARDRIQEIANKNAKFKAIDKAIGRNSLKIVTLLRLSPLLPLALSNYLYGLTSVDLGSYVLGSWAGMLPGTIAYVAAGAILPLLQVKALTPRHGTSSGCAPHQQNGGLRFLQFLPQG